MGVFLFFSFWFTTDTRRDEIERWGEVMWIPTLCSLGRAFFRGYHVSSSTYHVSSRIIMFHHHHHHHHHHGHKRHGTWDSAFLLFFWTNGIERDDDLLLHRTLKTNSNKLCWSSSSSTEYVDLGKNIHPLGGECFFFFFSKRFINPDEFFLSGLFF